jgi:hypothetical protein
MEIREKPRKYLEIYQNYVSRYESNTSEIRNKTATRMHTKYHTVSVLLANRSFPTL